MNHLRVDLEQGLYELRQTCDQLGADIRKLKQDIQSLTDNMADHLDLQKPMPHDIEKKIMAGVSTAIAPSTSKKPF